MRCTCRCRGTDRTPGRRTTSPSRQRTAVPGSALVRRCFTVEALLARILEDPDDLAARAVYGDALTEAGDPRGEFVSLQCLLAAAGIERIEDFLDLEVDAKELARLVAIQRRVQQLRAQHGARWLAELDLPADVAVEYRRGFPEAIQIGFHADPVAVIAQLERRTPIGELALDRRVTAIPRLRQPAYLRALAMSPACDLAALAK